MATFALRSAIGTSALRGGDALRVRSFTAGWHLYIDGVDAISRADITTWRITDGGPDATGKLSVDHVDLANAYPISAGAFVEVVDGTGSLVYWSGFTGSREQAPLMPRGRVTRMEAVDIGRALDTCFIVADETPAGDDRTAVQYLVSRYGLRGLRAPDATVQLTNTDIGAVPIANQTLRQALAAVATVAGGDRFVFVDADGRVNYGRAAAVPAPYAITDTAPDGTTSIAANGDPVTMDWDDDSIVNAYWCVGTGESPYGEWVTDDTSILAYGRREGSLTNEAIVDSTTAQLYGTAQLAKTKDPSVRGTFAVVGKDGWAAGQAVTITDAVNGLSAAVYQIAEVETRWLNGMGKRAYRIAFGELPRSMARAIAASIAKT